MRILVLDGNENQAVAAVRSLARAGHRPAVGSDTRWSKAGCSRSATSTFRYPPPAMDAAAFVNAVVREVAREPGTLVMPMTEASTLPLSLQRQQITGAGGRLVLPSHEVVLRAFNKHEMTALARSLGIAVPRTLTLPSASDLRDHVHALAYPLVLKPAHSHELTPAGTVRTTGGPRYARNEPELLAAWEDLARRCRTVLVQEYVEGTGAGYFALLNHGALRAEFAHRRLRDVRPTGSGSALRISVRPSPGVRDAALAILQMLEWHGAAMVEFRVRPDGTPVFLEVNGRFWNSLALAVYAGVDFPAMVAQLAADGDVPAQTSYRLGVRCRWLLGDVRHLIEVWRGRPHGFPGAFPDRWRTLLAVMTPVRGTFHDNFALDDPWPLLADAADVVVHRLGRKRAVAKVWHGQRRPSPS
jgi:predicted ATP-grasp superfamily ATP-dependent carboligase